MWVFALVVLGTLVLVGAALLIRRSTPKRRTGAG
jgi:hypothetical protein